MPLPFSVLRIRNFRLHFVGQVVSNVGTWCQSLAQALLVLELTGSGKALGLVTALTFAPVLLLGPHAGALADRMPRRALLALSAVLSGVAAGALALATSAGEIRIEWIYATALSLGVLQALARPTAESFLYELVGPEQLSRAIGMHSTTQSGARMLGPALGGAVYATLGAAACFALNAASFAFVALLLWRMERGALFGAAPAALEHGGRSLRAALHYARLRPELRMPLLVNLGIGCLAFNFMTTVTAMVRFELGGDASAVGAAHALNAAGAVVGSLWVASLGRAPLAGDLARVCAAMAVTIGVNALCPTQLIFLLWAPLFGLTIGAYQTAILTAVQQRTEPSMLGRMSALVGMGSVGMAPIASLIAGWLIDEVSSRAAMGLGALACAAGAVALARPLQGAARAARTA